MLLLEDQSKQMWADYTSTQLAHTNEDISPSDEPHEPTEAFWGNYEELIEQSKLRRVYTEPQLGEMIDKTLAMDQIFYKHWNATFVTTDYVLTRKASATGISSGVVFVLSVLVGFPVSYLYLDSVLAAMVLVSLLLAAVSSVNANGKKKTKVKLEKTVKGEIIFTPEKLIYRKMYYQAMQEIDIPYALMHGLWHDEEGVTIVGENQQKLWDGHRVTFSTDIDNWAEIHDFLNEVVSYNKMKKFDKLAGQK
jgi:hypothetical protein